MKFGEFVMSRRARGDNPRSAAINSVRGLDMLDIMVETAETHDDLVLLYPGSVPPPDRVLEGLDKLDREFQKKYGTQDA